MVHSGVTVTTEALRCAAALAAQTAHAKMSQQDKTYRAGPMIDNDRSSGALLQGKAWPVLEGMPV